MDILINIFLAFVSGILASLLFTLLSYYLKKKQNKITIKSDLGKSVNIDISNVNYSIDNIYQSLGPPYVFLSYSFKDKQFAKKIADDLKANGIRVWYDEYDLKLGDNLLEKINEGLSKSAYFGVILSKSYLESKWANKELEFMLKKEAKQKMNKILPILIDDVEMPNFLQNKVYADFTKDYTSGLNFILKKLKAN